MAIQGPKIESGVSISIPGIERAGGEVAVVKREFAPVVPPPDQPRTQDEIKEVHAQITERLRQYLRDSGRNLEFRVDDAAHATVTTVRRADTGEVVRQFPTEDALALLRRLNEYSGTFLDTIA